MTYWWVSQGVTYTKEYRGGYLWAPLISKSGKKIHHWESMKDVKNGDIVFSYVSQAIVAVSKVVSSPYEAIKPFNEGEDWQRQGVKINLEYFILEKPLKLSIIIDDLQAILEKQSKHKPLNKWGQQNQGYLYPLIDEAGLFLLEKIERENDLNLSINNPGSELKEQENEQIKKSLEEKSFQRKILKETHLSFEENETGISFDTIFGPYLKGAKKIIITDPYVRVFYQIRNLMEFTETVAKYKQASEEVVVHLVTTKDPRKYFQQQESFERMKESCSSAGIFFTYEFRDYKQIHARHIITDQGWKILLDRGLDIFKHYEMRDTFDFSNRIQEFRSCKPFEITFLKHEEADQKGEVE